MQMPVSSGHFPFASPSFLCAFVSLRKVSLLPLHFSVTFSLWLLA